MGLSSDIFDTLKTSLEEATELNEGQINNIQNISDGLANAIATFIQAQIFTITNMKASVQIENLTTQGPLNLNTNAPIVGTPNPNPVVIPPNKQILFEQLNLGNTGGQGGVLKSKAFAYLGDQTPSVVEDSDNSSEVTLTSIRDGSL